MLNLCNPIFFFSKKTDSQYRKPYKETKAKPQKIEKAVDKSPEKIKDKAEVDVEGMEIQTPIIRKKKEATVKVGPRRPVTPTKVAAKAAVVTDQPKQDQTSPVDGKDKDSDSFVTSKVEEIKLIKDTGKQSEVKDPKEEDEKDDKNDGDSKKKIRIKKGDKERPTSQGKKRPKDNQWKPAMVSDGDILLSQIKEAVINEESENEDGERRTGEFKIKKKWELTEEQEKQIREMSAQYGVEVEALKSYLETKATNSQFNWIGIKRLDNKVIDVNLELSKLESEYE